MKEKRQEKAVSYIQTTRGVSGSKSSGTRQTEAVRSRDLGGGYIGDVQVGSGGHGRE